MQLVSGTTYRHFKGDVYLLLDLAEHSETGETMVVYKAIYGSCKVYVRPMSQFVSEVDKDKYPHAGQKYRFEPITLPGIKDC